MTAPRRLALTLVWTAVLAAGLYGADRFLLGDRPTGWQRALAMEAIPPEAGVIPTPRIVPEHLGWPPRVILYRVGPETGCWLGLAGATDDEPPLWIGVGAPPLPESLEPLAGCVSPLRVDCPAGWRSLSVGSGGATIHVLGALPPAEMRRVIKGLEPHDRDGPEP